MATIREADLCNFVYVPGLVSLHGGLGELHEYPELGGPHDTTLHRLTTVAYGDLDADGREDVVVGVSEENYPATAGAGWSGTRMYLVVVRQGVATVVAHGDAPPEALLHIDASRVVAEWPRGEQRCRVDYRVSKTSFELASPERCAAR